MKIAVFAPIQVARINVATAVRLFVKHQLLRRQYVPRDAIHRRNQ
jgi:hypothetical protein